MEKMSYLIKLKRELEMLCGIAEWNPSEHELLIISEEINTLYLKNKIKSLVEVKSIVHKHFPKAFYRLSEGVDNSDLRTLIKLALLASKLGK